MNKIAILLMSFSLALCQPGKPGGPGGQYGNKMEMMMVWKMTEYLNLSEQQAEKLFPRMRRQRIKMDDFFVTEKTPYKEIADILTISENSAKVSYHHAVKSLKEKLKK